MKALLRTLLITLFLCGQLSAAIVTRYFSTTAAGDADGTSWANRAALFDGVGVWTNIVDGFDFSGSDSLLCYIGPGTYTCTETLAAANFANPPTSLNPLIFHGCDASGTPLMPPDPNWVSAQPAWDDSALPVIETTANIATVNGALKSAILIKFTASGRTSSYVIQDIPFMNWCVISNSTSSTGTAGVLSSLLANSVVECSGTSYNYIVSLISSAQPATNTRIIGSGTATDGNRNGIQNGSTGGATGCAIIGCEGAGIAQVSASISQTAFYQRNTIVDCGVGILLDDTGGQSAYFSIQNCYIANSATYGIDVNAVANALIIDSRVRDSGTADFNATANYPITFNNYTMDGADTEFADYAGGDYRISASSSLWGQRYGAGDQIPTATEIAAEVWARDGRSLTE